MEVERKNAICPCCDCEIKWIKQFPLARLTSFQSYSLPNLIKVPLKYALPLYIVQERFFMKTVVKNPHIPQEVIQGLSNSNEFSYQGRVYEKENGAERSRKFLESSVDSSSRRYLNHLNFGSFVKVSEDITDDVKKFLFLHEETIKTLEESVGKIMSTKDIFDSLSINHDYPTDLREFSFGIDEHDFGECRLNVDSARQEADLDLGFLARSYTSGFSLEIAKFAYEGLFRESSML